MTRKYIIIGIVVLVIFGIVGFFFVLKRSPKIVNYPLKNYTIVAFGDSLVAGYGATTGNDFVSLLSAKLNRPIINMGVNGDTTEDALNRIEDPVSNDPGIVILLLGGNDFLHQVALSQTFANLQSIIDRFQAQGSMVVLLGVRGGLVKDGYKESFQGLADKSGVIFVPDVLDGLFGKSSFMTDTVHPNDAGYQKIAERVYDAMKNNLKLKE